MNLAEAIEAFERDLEVSDEVGFTPKGRPEAKVYDRAPNGDRYVILTSAGVRARADGPAALFGSEDAAAMAWLLEAWKYAEERGGKTLYWASRPVYEEAEFVAVDQAAAINSPVLNTSMAIRLGIVQARLVVTKGAAKQEKE